jgi:hypothetical protein
MSMTTINRFTEDEARTHGFTDDEIRASRTREDGYLGTRNGVLCYNLQVDIRMGDVNPGSGTRGTLPPQFGDA